MNMFPIYIIYQNVELAMWNVYAVPHRNDEITVGEYTYLVTNIRHEGGYYQNSGGTYHIIYVEVIRTGFKN